MHGVGLARLSAPGANRSKSQIQLATDIINVKYSKLFIEFPVIWLENKFVEVENDGKLF